MYSTEPWPSLVTDGRTSITCQLCFISVIPTRLQRSCLSLLLGQRREAQVRLHDAEIGEQRLETELARR